MLRITDEISLQDWVMTESFVRASGPGGGASRTGPA